MRVISVFLLTILCCNPSSGQSLTFEQSGGPVGGNVVDMAVTPDGLMIAAVGASFWTRLSTTIYTSSDNGASWSFSDTFQAYDVDIEVLPDGQVLLLAHGHDIPEFEPGGIFRMEDRGRRWEQILDDTDDAYVIDLLVRQDGTLVATTTAGILMSSDSGESWSPLETGAAISTDDFNDGVSLAESADQILFAFAGDTLYQLDEQGNASVLSSSLPLFERPRNRQPSIAPSGSIFLFDRLYNASRLFRSQDDGASWSNIADSIPEEIIGGFHLTSEGHLIVGAPGQNLLYWSVDEGETWQSLALPAHPSVWSSWEFKPSREGRIYAFSESLFGSDGMASFELDLEQAEAVRVPIQGVVATEITEIEITLGDKLLALENGSRVFVSDDEGYTWNQVDQLRPYQSQLWSQRINSMAMGPSGKVLVLSDPHLFLSTDDADSWTVLADTFDFYIEAVHVDEVGNLYVASYNEVHQSTDDGATWSRSSADILSLYSDWAVPSPDFALDDVCSVVEESAGIYFATTCGLGEVFISENEGVSWQEVTSGLWGIPVNDVAMTADGYLYAATRGGGIFRSTTPVVTSREPEIVGSSAGLRLINSYPNPTNGETSIRLEVGEQARASIDVVNILGQIVANPFEGTLTPGVHTVR